MTKNDKPETVILIHGTFAAADSDEGKGWWQRGSDFWGGLKKRLPESVQLQEEGPLFHWSGANTQRGRQTASLDLLQYVSEFEANSQPYHLVAHSHGGTALWNALIESIESGKPLRHLRSWTTVSTPFLRFSSKRSPSFYEGVGFIGFAAACALLWGVLLLMREISKVDPPWYQLIPVLAVMSVFLFLIVGFGKSWMVPMVEARSIRAATKARPAALREYGSKWLGIWSPDDEAINGLRTAVGFEAELERTESSSRRVFASDSVPGLRRIISDVFPGWPMLFGGLSSAVVTQVANTIAHGNDRPTATLSGVSVGLTDGDESAYLPLPESVYREITQRADAAASEFAPKLREAIGLSAIGAAITRLGDEFSGSEMVHTSYFDHDDVVELIALHIESTSNLEESSDSNPLRTWVRDFKESVKTNVLDELPD